MDLIKNALSLSHAQTQKIHNERIKDKVFVVKYPEKSRPKSRRKPKRMSNTERRKRGMYDLADIKYSSILPLHYLWTSYMDELLSSATENTWAQKLLKADYHGMCVTITRSKNPLLIGLTGIIVLEMENVFKIVTEHDDLKVIPKENTVFTTVLKDKSMTLFGNHCRFRAADRSSRKFKQKISVDL